MRSRALILVGLLVVVAVVVLVIMLGRRDASPPPQISTTPPTTTPVGLPPVQPPTLPGAPSVAEAAPLPRPVLVAGSSPSAFGGHAAIAGRVVLEDGAPVPFYGIVLSKLAGRHYADQPVPVRDADGRFNFQKIVAGTWNLAIEGPGIARHVVTGVQLVDDTVTDVGTIKVHAGLRISGRVLDGSSHGIAGATVRLNQGGFTIVAIDGAPMTDPALSQQQAKTDASGHYVLRGIGPESGGWLEASRGDAAHAIRHPIPEADATIDFVFDPTGGIDGEVEGGGNGMVSARMGREHQVGSYRDGAFTFDHLQPGEYVVTATTLGRGAAPRPVRVTVPVNQRAHALIARPRSVVTLVATGACEALMLFAIEEEPEWHGFSPLARLAWGNCKDGQAVIEGVAPGGYWVCSNMNNNCMTIEVAESPPRQSVVLALEPLKVPPPVISAVGAAPGQSNCTTNVSSCNAIA